MRLFLSTMGLVVIAAIALGVGAPASPRQQATPAASTAQQATLPGDAASRRLRNEIAGIERLLPQFVDRGAALYLLAHHYARLGDTKKALALLKECLALDEGFDPLTARAFAVLKSDTKFDGLAEEAHRRYPPVHRAHVAFTVPEGDLFPEGLAIDAEKRLFYMGSMHRKKIVKITESGEVSDFVKQDLYDLMPVGGVHADPADHSIWAATDPGEKNRSEIVHFDAQGKLIERYAAPGAGPHALNDLVLRDGGEIYTTDTFGNKVYRFDRKSHSFAVETLSRPVFEPNGITVSGDGRLLYVADNLGVIRVDLGNNESREVNPGAHNTLAGIDGLYWYKGDLVGVQYGTGAFRVMRWKLSADGRSVTNSEVLERGTEMVDDPTTGAILDDKFYFMANTGIYNLEDDKVIDPAKLEPVHIAVILLK